MSNYCYLEHMIAYEMDLIKSGASSTEYAKCLHNASLESMNYFFDINAKLYPHNKHCCIISGSGYSLDKKNGSSVFFINFVNPKIIIMKSGNPKGARDINVDLFLKKSQEYPYEEINGLYVEGPKESKKKCVLITLYSSFSKTKINDGFTLNCSYRLESITAEFRIKILNMEQSKKQGSMNGRNSILFFFDANVYMNKSDAIASPKAITGAIANFYNPKSNKATTHVCPFK